MENEAAPCAFGVPCFFICLRTQLGLLRVSSLCVKGPPAQPPLPLGQAFTCTPQHFVISAPFPGSTGPCALGHSPLTPQIALCACPVA